MTSNDISWYQLISHPCPSTLHKHCKHSAMLWHSLDALALWAFQACDWETLSLMQSLIISYLLNLFLSHRHADRFVLQTSKEALGSHQRFCESPQKRLNKYTSTVIYRDMPWYMWYKMALPTRFGHLTGLERKYESQNTKSEATSAGHLQDGIEQRMIQ